MDCGESLPVEAGYSLQTLASGIGNIISNLPVELANDAAGAVQHTRELLQPQIGRNAGSSALHEINDILEEASKKLGCARETLLLASTALRGYLHGIGVSLPAVEDRGSLGIISATEAPHGAVERSKHVSDEHLYDMQALIGAHANSLDPKGFCALLRGGGASVMRGEIKAGYQRTPNVDAEEIAYRTGLVRAYGSIVPIVNIILSRDAAEWPPNLSHLSTTTASNTYVYRDEDGRRTVIKINRDHPNFDCTKLEGEVSAIVRLRDNPRFVKPNSISYTDGIIATEFLPYPVVVDMAPDQLQAIRTEHLIRLREDLMWARRQKVLPDMIGNNLLYDLDTGFYIIDPFGVDFEDRGEEDTQILLAHTAMQLGDLHRNQSIDLARDQAAARLELVERFAELAQPYLEPGRNFNNTILALRFAAGRAKPTT